MEQHRGAGGVGRIAVAMGEERQGGPADCDLTGETEWMFRTLWRVGQEAILRLRDLLSRDDVRGRVVTLDSPEAIASFMEA